MLHDRLLTFVKQGQYNEAQHLVHTLVKEQPDEPLTRLCLATLYRLQNQAQKAVPLLQQVVQVGDSDLAERAQQEHYWLCTQLNQFSQAKLVAERLSQLYPDKSLYAAWIGDALRSQYKDFEAIPSYQNALNSDSTNSAWHQSLGMCFSFTGQSDKALVHLLEASSNDPSNQQAHSQAAYHSNYVDDLSEQRVLAIHKQSAKRLVGAIKPFKASKISPGKTKIAFLSGDLREHSVAYFLLPIVEHWDNQQSDLVFYSDVSQSDAFTEKFRSYANRWVDCASMDDKALYEQVRNDGIDILVDLISFSRGPRLGVFARRAAPIQVTYLAYPNTTGLDTMDFRIVDGFTDPEGEADELTTEELIRLPNCFLCYQPSDSAPEISELPAISKGHITFGSFNKMPKVTETMLSNWIALLQSLPSAKLYIKSSAFLDSSFSEHLLSQFASSGIEASRLILASYSHSTADHLAEYANIDIHLDTYPYNGTTTTCEAMWQGVPTVTLCGSSHRSRVSADIIKQIGLEKELVCLDSKTYIDKAIALASDIETLANLRSNMREKMSKSDLMNAPLFSRQLQHTLLKLKDRQGKT